MISADPGKLEVKTKPDALLANGILAFYAGAFLNAFLVIAKEMVPPLKQALASTFGHHWVGHGVVLLLLVGVVLGVASTLKLHERLGVGDGCARRYVVTGTVAGVLMLVGFYVVDVLVG
ncbi:MAG: hypothetical protein SFY68_07500 [Candidatus Sumerlaeia bacterium]|nr:hypothetical protein [Candidatus Sumerlaeia bacterium]